MKSPGVAVRITLAACALFAAPIAAQAPPPPPATPTPAAAAQARRSVELSGLILINGFFNSARVNNSDVPQLAAADTNPASGGGATLRQTRLRVIATEPDVLGATATGEVDVDFFGGQPPAGGRTFPLLRLRRALATLSWAHAEVLVGQEAPLVAGRDPRSLASLGFPTFASAGNLWLWIPQGRVTVEAGYTLRLAVQAAVLAPTANTPQGAFATQPDSAERTARPFAQGRLRLGWGPTDDPSELAVGGHIGWLRNFDATTGDSLIQSRAVTVDARVKLGEIEIRGEVFAGQALSVLGGGGVGQTVGPNGEPVRTKGGWGQLNLRLRRSLLVGGGCGIDDPDDADLVATAPRRNLVCGGHVEWRPAVPGPIVLSFEMRRLQTTYATGDFTVTHLNIGGGWQF
jgi:hypothetical protein